MAADRSATSRQQSYADQYLSRGARSQDPEADPYGSWYAERLHRAGGFAEAAPHRREPARPDDRADIGTSDTAVGASEGGAEHGEAGRAPDAHRVGATTGIDAGAYEIGAPTVGNADTEADAPAAGPEPMPEPAPEPRAKACSFAPPVLRQLEQNYSQLSLVEGNLVAAGQSDVSSVYITSCFPGEGKTTAALSTVYGLCAISQARVLLIDGGNQAARLHSMLSMSSYPGFNEVVEGRVDLSDALHPVAGMPNLHVLACGAVDHAMLSETRRLEQIRAFLTRVRPHYDFVVVDGGATLSSSDPARLARCFDGLVFVVACERTKWEVLQGAVEKVRNGGGQVLGGVLNRRRFYVPKLIYQWISR